MRNAVKFAGISLLVVGLLVLVLLGVGVITGFLDGNGILVHLYGSNWIWLPAAWMTGAGVCIILVGIDLLFVGRKSRRLR